MFINEISVEQSTTTGVVQYEMVIWTTPDEASSRMNYCSCGAALSHSLCLDMNGKESIPGVVNTEGLFSQGLFCHPNCSARNVRV